MVPYIPTTLGPLTINGSHVINGNMNVQNVAPGAITTMAILGGSGATLQGTIIFYSSSAQKLSILTSGSGGVQFLAGSSQLNALSLGVNANAVIGPCAGGATALEVIGDAANGQSNGLIVSAGGNNTDANTIFQSFLSTQFAKIYGDGSLVVGSSTIVNKGAGTFNALRLYQNNVPLTAGGSVNNSINPYSILADEPMQDDGFALPFNLTPPIINAVSITVRQPGSTTTTESGNDAGLYPLRVFAAPNSDGFGVFGAQTTGQSYGGFYQAGTTSPEMAHLYLLNAFGSIIGHFDGVGNYTCTGDIIAGSQLTAKGAIPAVTAGQTDLGITTTATVITTAGGIALPALAATFWAGKCEWGSLWHPLFCFVALNWYHLSIGD